jgi:hypothetical protein
MIVELRNYQLEPSRREEFIGHFERQLLHTQEAVGMGVLGQFTVADAPDRFVWLRSFPDMLSRRVALEHFYGGPVWRQHGPLANEIMTDSDDVLLLRPSITSPDLVEGYRPAPSAPPDLRRDGSGIMLAAITLLAGRPADVEPSLATALERAARDLGVRELARLVAEPAPNDFARLPVRQEPGTFVWLVGAPGACAHARADGTLIPASMNRAWLITQPSAESGAQETLPYTAGLVTMTRDELAASDMSFTNGERVAITSEAAMDIVVSRLDPVRSRAIDTLKDKFAFRQMLRPLYPDFTFATVATQDLRALRLDPDQAYVIKPARGAFGAGVRTITGDADLAGLQDEIVAEIERNAAVLSPRAFSSERLVVEQCITGEEYAADVFFDQNGDPVLTGTYHHPMPANPAYLHMLYYTSPRVWDLIAPQAAEFFTALNKRLGVTNLAMHAEFRLQRGRLTPIEINALRFGGMGLGHMVHHVLGINPYRHFIAGTRPDETRLRRDPRAAVFFIAYNGATIDTTTHCPDWTRLRKRFTEILLEVPFDYRTQLAFGILYAREPEDRIAELLRIEFDEMFVAGQRPVAEGR